LKEEEFVSFLHKEQYIDLTLKMKLLLYVKLYNMYKPQINVDIELKNFLAISVPEIYCNIVFRDTDHEQSYKNIYFLLTKIAEVWDPINKELDEQILKEEQTQLNRVDIENTPVFESHLKECFEIANATKHA
jgi:hypothetical protein